MKKDENTKKILIGITLFLVILLLGVLIWQAWIIKNKDKSKDFLMEKNDTNINLQNNNIAGGSTSNQKSNEENNNEMIKRAETLYEKAKDIYFGEYLLDDNIVTINNEEYSQLETDIILNTFSKTGLKNFIDGNKFVTKNNLYYRMNADRGGNIDFISRKFVLIKQTDNEITFNLVSTYCDDDEWDLDNCKKTYDETRIFIMEKEDNIWKIKQWEIDI